MSDHDLNDGIIDEPIRSSVKLHPKALQRFAVARFAERFAFWGAWLMLFMYIFEKNDSYTISIMRDPYGVLIVLFGAVQIIGGWLADKLLDARVALVWGGALLAVGYFVFSFGTTLSEMAGLVFVLSGAALYVPSATTSVARYYRGREAYLYAGMNTYSAAIFAAGVAASFFFGFVVQFIGWRQGFMLCGIAMMAGHIYLLAVAKTFQEPLPPKVVVPQLEPVRSNFNILVPVLVLAAILLFNLLSTFRYEPFVHNDSLYSGRIHGASVWLTYFHSLVIVVTMLMLGWMLTLRPAGVGLRMGLGALMGIGVFVVAIGLFMYNSPAEPTLIRSVSAIGIVGLAGLAEAFLFPAVLTMLLRYGKAYINTWVGVLSTVFYLPYLFRFQFTGGDAATGIIVVLSTAGLASLGLWFIKNNKVLDADQANEIK